MPQVFDAPEASFVDRRSNTPAGAATIERRQFSNNHEHLSPQAREFAQTVDEYKLRHRRRFITYEEILDVVLALGYRK